MSHVFLLLFSTVQCPTPRYAAAASAAVVAAAAAADDTTVRNIIKNLTIILPQKSYIFKSPFGRYGTFALQIRINSIFSVNILFPYGI